jgi:hypothetical protein
MNRVGKIWRSAECPLQGIHEETGLENDRGYPSKTMLSRDVHGRKIRSRKQRTDIGNYFFVNRTTKDWNRSPAGVLASLSCNLNTFRKRIREAVTSKEALSGGLNGNK